MPEVEQRMEQLPTRAGMPEVEQRMEQLPTSPAAERNKQPIADVLARVLPRSGLVLEIASGTGQHAEHFARAFPALKWQPSEPAGTALAILAESVRRAALPNLRAPIELDVHEPPPLDDIGAVVCSNMIHIAPWSACAALLVAAERWLAPGAPLVLYGPFKRGGRHTAPSNAAFDADLRRRNPEWGVRDLDDVAALARRHSLALAEVVAMPANNFTVVLRRQ
jgi:SAM-dependent methyltransferase